MVNDYTQFADKLKAVWATIYHSFTDWRRGASIETRSWLL
jgi:hypothetical protein